MVLLSQRSICETLLNVCLLFNLYIIIAVFQREKLEQESDEIDKQFAKLVVTIHQSLITRNVTKTNLGQCIMSVNRRKTVTGKSLSKLRQKVADPDATVSTVWLLLGDYVAFFDFDILGTIVDTIGTDEDKRALFSYEKTFEEYVKRRLFKSDSGGLIFILDSSYDGLEVEHLQKHLTRILNLESGVVQLVNIEDYEREGE